MSAFFFFWGGEEECCIECWCSGLIWFAWGDAVFYFSRVNGTKWQDSYGRSMKRKWKLLYSFLGTQIALKWSLIFDSDTQSLGIVSWIAAMYLMIVQAEGMDVWGKCWNITQVGDGSRKRRSGLNKPKLAQTWQKRGLLSNALPSYD